MPATRPGHVEITNTQRDTLQLRRVWKTEDGRRPAAGAAGAAEVESFQLELGSDDDDNDEARDDGVLQPTQQVPTWALALYRAMPLFKGWEESGRVRVHRSA